jgi:hypothetical protein
MLAPTYTPTLQLGFRTFYRCLEDSGAASFGCYASTARYACSLARDIFFFLSHFFFHLMRFGFLTLNASLNRPRALHEGGDQQRHWRRYEDNCELPRVPNYLALVF